jgi:nitrite reductase/ring-hydroxylating ferredoxin subunit
MEMRAVVGMLTDFPEGRGMPIQVGRHRLAVFRVGESVFAVEDRCAHRGFPLHDGTLDGNTVSCRTHGACYELATGAVVRGPARRAIRAYPASVEDGQVVVEISDR